MIGEDPDREVVEDVAVGVGQLVYEAAEALHHVPEGNRGMVGGHTMACCQGRRGGSPSFAYL